MAAARQPLVRRSIIMSDTIENASSTAQNDPAVAASSVEAAPYTQRQTLGQLLRGDLGFIPVLITLIIIVIFFQFFTGGLFLRPRNVAFLFVQTATIGSIGL